MLFRKVPVCEPPRETRKFAAITALVGAAAAAVLIPTVQRWEGTVYKGYQDPVGIATKCTGDTSNVVLDRVYTPAQCDESLERQLLAHARPVMECVPRLARKPNALAASVSLAYNIGTSAFCRSTAAKRFNRGDIKGGCDAMLLWNRAGGRVLKGLDNRRRAEREICMKDAA